MNKYVKLFEQIASDNDIVLSLLQDFTRHYFSEVMPAEDMFTVDEEDRKWPHWEHELEIGLTKKEDCSFKIKFTNELEEYLMEIEFSIDYKGIADYDHQDTPELQDTRPGVSLENLTINSFRLQGTGIEYNKSTLERDILEGVKKIVLEIMHPEFDKISNPDLSFSQL